MRGVFSRSSFELLTILLCALLMSMLPPQAEAARKKGKRSAAGLILQQRSKLFGGALTVYVTSRAVRWSNTNSGVTILARAPRWDVILYNTRLRNYTTCKFDRFYNPATLSLQAMMVGFKPDSIKFSRFTPVKVMGVPMKHYIYRAPSTKQVPHIAHYWTITDSPVNAKNSAVIAKIYSGVPRAPGLPVKFMSQRSSQSKMRVGIATNSIERKRLAVSLFRVPAGYKREKDVQDVWTSRFASDAFENMLKIKDRAGK